MNTSNLLCAIDIGTNKVVVGIARRELSGKLTIVDIQHQKCTGLKRGIILNIEETVSALRDALIRAERVCGQKVTEAYIGYGGIDLQCVQNKALCYINPGKEINQSDLDELKNKNSEMPLAEDEAILHILPVDYNIDNEKGVSHPIGRLGRNLEGNFNIILAKQSSLSLIDKCLSKAGIKSKKNIYDSLAIANSTLSKEEKEAGVVLVDLGGGKCTVSVFSNGVLMHTSVIPLGANLISSDIEKGCGIMLKDAELAKEQYGSALAESESDDDVIEIQGVKGWENKTVSFKTLAYIIQARLEEIADYVDKQIGLSGLKKQLGAGIVLTGATAKMKNIEALIKMRTHLNVRIGTPTALDINCNSEFLNNVCNSLVIGLLEEGRKDVNESVKNRLNSQAFATSSTVNQAKPDAKEDKEDVHEDTNSNSSKAKTKGKKGRKGNSEGKQRSIWDSIGNALYSGGDSDF